MTHDDVLHHFRVRLFALADELGNVRAACWMLGVHPSTYDRWRKPMLRWGLDALRPPERRAPQMPNRTPLWMEAQILALSLGLTACGSQSPQRSDFDTILAPERCGGMKDACE